jgi:TolB-like protein/Flp pilus assembly protein TadD
MSLSPGTRLGPYEILLPLGAGGMGEVYRARDTRLGRDVAVKVLPAEVANDADRLHRFEREARAASALNHPNILTVHDVGNDGGVAFLVTELLRGESLREALSGGALPARRVVEIATQIARGLAAAHERGIVHRDLKPENLFLTSDGAAKILDFGLARLEGKAAGPPSEGTTIAESTSAGMMLGTVGYMAPEQVRGERADARSDLFAFGCVLYEMLGGRNPFRRESAIESFHAILKEEPPRIDSAAPVPAPLEQILRHCLEKAPERRFQSASDLAFALEQAIPAPASPSAAPSPAVLPQQPRRRIPVPALLGGGAALLAILLFVLNVAGLRSRFLGAASGGTIDSLAVLPLANFSGDPAQEFFADGMTEALIAELAKIRALKVISRTSVMQYKNAKRPLPEIARALGVRGVVEGSVMREGGSVRITVQLIDAPQDRHVWAESYTRESRDVLRMQAEVAQAIARAVRVAVTPKELERLAGVRAVDPEAHLLLLQASDLIRRGSSQLDVQERISALLDRALALAPDFARAHALRANQLYSHAGTGYESGTSACPSARAELQRALELDPELVEARILDGTLRESCDFDWSGSLGVYERLLESAPGDAGVHDALSQLLTNLGRHDEAIRHVRRAFELDPLNDWIGGHYVYSLTVARQYPEALQIAHQVLAVSPDSVFVKWTLANAQLAMGHSDEALATYMSRKVSNPGMNFMVGLLHGLAGRPGEAKKVLDYLLARRSQRYVPASMIAVVHGGLGERDAAFEWLERAYDERDFFLLDAQTDPRFDPFRGDPRFGALLAKMNYPRGAP